MFLHLLPVVLILLLVDPLGRVPVLAANQAKAHLAARKLAHALLELERERHLVEERPRVVVFVVELCLERVHAHDYALQVAVPRQHQQRCVRQPRRRVHRRADRDVHRRVRRSDDGIRPAVAPPLPAPELELLIRDVLPRRLRCE